MEFLETRIEQNQQKHIFVYIYLYMFQFTFVSISFIHDIYICIYIYTYSTILYSIVEHIHNRYIYIRTYKCDESCILGPIGLRSVQKTTRISFG